MYLSQNGTNRRAKTEDPDRGEGITSAVGDGKFFPATRTLLDGIGQYARVLAENGTTQEFTYDWAERRSYAEVSGRYGLIAALESVPRNPSAKSFSWLYESAE